MKGEKEEHMKVLGNRKENEREKRKDGEINTCDEQKKATESPRRKISVFCIIMPEIPVSTHRHKR
jgi:hypothetical protein